MEARELKLPRRDFKLKTPRARSAPQRAPAQGPILAAAAVGRDRVSVVFAIAVCLAAGARDPQANEA